jgi:hypothetical protein
MERSDLDAFSFVRDRSIVFSRWQLLAAGASTTLDRVDALHSTGVVPRLRILSAIQHPVCFLTCRDHYEINMLSVQRPSIEATSVRWYQATLTVLSSVRVKATSACSDGV